MAGPNIFIPTSASDFTSPDPANANKIWEIQSPINLTGASVTLPTSVYLKDMGGGLTNGTITLEGNSSVDSSILNYELNWGAATEGKLTSPLYFFIKDKWGIDENILSPAWNHVIGRDIANTNKERFKKSIEDGHRLGGNEMVVDDLDVYFYTADPLKPIEQNNIVLSERSIEIPSGFTLRNNTSNVHYRLYPDFSYGKHLFSINQTKGSSIIGGNFYGTRLTHRYKIFKHITNLPDPGTTQIEIAYELAENPTLTTVTITDATDEAQIAQDIVNHFNNNVVGYTAQLEPTFNYVSNTIFSIDNGQTGVQFDWNESNGDTSGIDFFGGLSDHSGEFGIYAVGAEGFVINGRGGIVRDMHGDGIIVTASGFVLGVGGTQARNGEIKNVTVDNCRRINVSILSGENIDIHNITNLNAGQHDGINLGTSPATAFNFEAFRQRDQTTGVISNGNFSRNCTIRNCTIIDARLGGIEAFNTLGLSAHGNTSNSTFVAPLSENVRFYNNIFDARLGNDASQIAFRQDVRSDTFSTTVRLNDNANFSNNIIYGDGTENFIGARIEGWGLTLEGNKFYNLGIAIKATGALMNAKLNFNHIETYTEYNIGIGIEMLSINVENLEIKGNTIKVPEQAIQLNNLNSSIQTGFHRDRLDLELSDNFIESTGGTFPYFRLVSSIVLFNNVFYNRVVFNNSSSDLIINHNDFKEGLQIGGTGGGMVNLQMFENDIRSSDTNAAFDFESRTLSENNFIGSNRFYQPLGTSAMLFDGSGSHENYKLFDNRLVVKGPSVNLIDGTLINSFIFNNIDIETGTNAQTISGTGNNIVDYGGGSGTTNLSNTTSPTGVAIESSSGTNTTIPIADETNAGLLSPLDKTKLNDITISNPIDFDANQVTLSTLSLFTTLQTGTGTAIPVLYAGYIGNALSANSSTSYTISQSDIGGWAKIRINSVSQPIVTGATLIDGAAFNPSIDMYLVIRSNGNRSEYYFMPY
ncbi:hypothetical protein HME9304_03305 [Flagellimonas maritima]|uniref:Uncharacterized protein n=1 Tax=Flagellimonas maritima TaxID=1383885 RepID=A0A2Z4LX31_9FLAO|nr:hypothetical protein [Allomuricauda aurantiaca]AWX46273.1 hypothetical protein HME9304_03305 [Allomuricauda aurantiaca]